MQILNRLLGVLAIVWSTAGGADAPSQPAAFDAGRVPFHTRIYGLPSDYRIRTVMVLPGKSVDIEGESTFRVEAKEGLLQKLSPTRWTWKAPDRVDRFPLEIISEVNGEKVTVNAFVSAPYSDMKKNRIRGYQIGQYRKGGPAYPIPEGFVEVTRENQDTFLTPHFQLKQFLCKQAGGFPKYVLLSEPLLIKLERVLERLNAEGVRVDTLHVMSGYRTPHYNLSLGNVRNSRHTMGDAADVFVDANGDGRMDDLNRDGRVDVADSLFLRNLVEALEKEGGREVAATQFKAGGLGVYSSNSAHGPFVHIDARGTPARWGLAPSAGLSTISKPRR